MSDPILDISTIKTKITEAATAAAAHQVEGAQAQKDSTSAQAELTVALHTQTDQRLRQAIESATKTIGESTNALVEKTVQGLQEQTTQRVTAAISPITQDLATLNGTVASQGQAIDKLANAVTQGQAELTKTMTNLASLIGELGKAQREAQQQYIPAQQFASTPQIVVPQQQYPQTTQSAYPSTYQPGYYDPGNTSSTSWFPSTYTSADSERTTLLAQAATTVALQTCRYSSAAKSAELAQKELATMGEHLQNLRKALKECGSNTYPASELVATGWVPGFRREIAEWQQELAHAFIGGITYGSSVASAYELAAAYERLTFASPDTMAAAVGTDTPLARAWDKAIRDARANSREVTLLTVYHPDGTFALLAESGGRGTVKWWNSTTGGWEATDPYSGSGTFKSFDAKAPTAQKAAHERSQDADRTLMEYLFGLYGNKLACNLEMVTSIPMCPSCTMVALQFLHWCPGVPMMTVRQTRVGPRVVPTVVTDRPTEATYPLKDAEGTRRPEPDLDVKRRRTDTPVNPTSEKKDDHH